VRESLSNKFTRIFQSKSCCCCCCFCCRCCCWNVNIRNTMYCI